MPSCCQHGEWSWVRILLMTLPQKTKICWPMISTARCTPLRVKSFGLTSPISMVTMFTGILVRTTSLWSLNYHSTVSTGWRSSWTIGQVSFHQKLWQTQLRHDSFPKALLIWIQLEGICTCIELMPKQMIFSSWCSQQNIEIRKSYAISGFPCAGLYSIPSYVMWRICVCISLQFVAMCGITCLNAVIFTPGPISAAINTDLHNQSSLKSICSNQHFINRSNIFLHLMQERGVSAHYWTSK